MLLGEHVLTRDEITGLLDYRPVTKQHISEYSETYEVSVRDFETGNIQVLKASATHPFFARLPENAPMAVGIEGLVYQGVIEWGHWVDTSDLKPGYWLLNDDETWAEVVAVDVVRGDLKAYNLTVEGTHTYFVAANDNAVPVWVHNCGGDALKNIKVGKALIPSRGLKHVGEGGRYLRAGFENADAARSEVRRVTKLINENGLPTGTIPHVKRSDTLWVPIGTGYGAYSIKPNGKLSFKTLISREMTLGKVSK